MNEQTRMDGGVEVDRPEMPDDYGIETGLEGVLPWSWVDERMAASRNYWIGSTRPDGRPHAMPVWGVWVDGRLVFGTGRQSRKARNLAENPQVVVHLESGDETVIFEGTVEEITDIRLLTRMSEAFSQKYAGFTSDPEPTPGMVWYAVNPQVVYAWTEKEFQKTPTRWRFKG